jgi:pimeloyl-ACP methyl ester carboxylesterase
VPSRLVTRSPGIELATSDTGDGPVVVLVHGVGIGAWAFAEVAAALAADHRVLVPHRRGYRPDGCQVEVPRWAAVDEQVDDLLRVLVSRGIGEATFVGVSGGATLVLALAMAAPGMVRTAVVHEPVIGPLAPELHTVLKAAAARLSSSGVGVDGVLEFITGLVGEERMAGLPAAGRHAIRRASAVVRAEVPAFIAFAPTAANLARLVDVPLVASLGSRSPEPRRLAAAVLAERAGARVEVLDGVRHLPQLEAPAAFEKVIREAIAAGAAAR